MDDQQLILSQQRQIRDLTKQLEQAHRETEEWRQRAEAIHWEYMELRDQIRRGDFVKARRMRVAE